MGCTELRGSLDPIGDVSSSTRKTGTEAVLADLGNLISEIIHQSQYSNRHGAKKSGDKA